jgi:hypothetical protein
MDGRMTLVDSCPKCGSGVWDNTVDVRAGQKVPVWRCKDKGCKDSKGYTTSEWTPNEELQAAYEARLGAEKGEEGPRGTADPRADLEPPAWLTEEDPDLTFPTAAEDKWVESMSIVLRAVDRVEAEKGWRPDNDALTRMVITQYLKNQ